MKQSQPAGHQPEGGLSEALLTDLYQLTMARGHWKAGRLDAEGSFLLSFRRAPFGGTWALASGVAEAIETLASLRFSEADLDALAALPGPGGSSLFEAEFLDVLRRMEGFDLDVDAVADGTVCLPGVPMVRVTGPLWQAQLVETFLLNRIGFETLVATKAARIVRAAADAAVLEFGARRAQGPDASIRSARASWVGGVAGTSNVLAGARLGIPVKGTHAHSWVQSFAGSGDAHETERQAFEAFAESMPDGCVLLVDTYDTRAGIENAIEVARGLRARGHGLSGIRLDSGDLVELSVHARKALSGAGFPDVKIVASDDLDERKIMELRARGAEIDVYGVGTRLVTGGEQAALGVVYKLSAVRENADEPWRPVMKLSSTVAKRSLPGHVEVQRVVRDGMLVGDFLSAATDDLSQIQGDREHLLRPAVRSGDIAPDYPLDLKSARERARAELARLPEGAFDLDAPEEIPVELSSELSLLQAQLIERATPAAAPIHQR
ncbi:Nicotinate phosphoribosyltransferase pncB2 [Planctomycetes bacterium Poly30]|uniref:Nicotinate phosphoribosyltransferase n=1 Tax=Saltatorellus ferox TaxID=2528018 RepID=A0A518EKP7_9BACT|nr:Nicotinate phosphoribosyltransferase pncB2 [Planctomycetes bacterium Poly30]